MKKLINLFLGCGEFRVTGAAPERFLNLCAGSGVRFWHIRWLDRTSFSFRALYKDKKRLEELSRKAMCDLEEIRLLGSAAAVRSLRKRWGFLAGMVLCLLAVSILSQFLLVVEVEGNERVSTAAILSELQRFGVYPGAWGPSVDTKEVCNEMMLAMPDLAYLTVRVSGTRAEVAVREKIPAPGLLDETVPADIVADADGIIEDIHPAAGRAMFADGDIVAKGEVLISGEMKLRPPQIGDVDRGWLVVRAAGEVYARTWRTLEETIPLQTAVKRYTGAETTLYTLRILWREAEFFQNSSILWERYDKITRTGFLTLFGRTLPLGVTAVTLREYTLEEQPLDTEDAARELELILRDRLADIMAEREGEVLRTDVVCRVEGGRLTVTLLAESREQIGRTVERPGETGRIPGTNAEPSAD